VPFGTTQEDVEDQLDFIKSASPIKVMAKRKQYGHRPISRKQHLAMNLARVEATREVKVSLPKLKYLGE